MSDHTRQHQIQQPTLWTRNSQRMIIWFWSGHTPSKSRAHRLAAIKDNRTRGRYRLHGDRVLLSSTTLRLVRAPAWDQHVTLSQYRTSDITWSHLRIKHRVSRAPISVPLIAQYHTSPITIPSRSTAHSASSQYQGREQDMPCSAREEARYPAEKSCNERAEKGRKHVTQLRTCAPGLTTVHTH
eukprot:3698752-Rhodomonas_salina.1